MKLLLSTIAVDPQERGIHIFAQALSEMLFDFAPDSYKAPALDTAVRAAEAKSVCKQIKDGRIKNAATAISLAEELSWSLETDKVAKKILGDDLWPFIKEVKDAKENPDALMRISSAILDRLLPKYLESCIEILKDMVRQPNSDGDIYNVAKSYCSHLISIGYDRTYVFYRMTYSFFYERKNINYVDRLSEFAAFFPGVPSQFKTYVWIHRSFLEAFDMESSNFSMSSDDNTHPDLRLHYSQFFSNSDDHVLITRDVRAMDAKSARASTEQRLMYIRSLIHTVYPESDLSWRDAILVVKNGSQRGHVLGSPDKPLLRRDTRKSNERDKVLSHRIKFWRNAKLADKSRYQLSISAQANAFRSESVESQLISCWSAFEVLLPEPSGVRITSYLRYIVACNSIYYSHRRFGFLNKDLFGAYRQRYVDFIGSDDEQKQIRELMNICILPSLSPRKADLLNMCDDRNPLAHHRVAWLSEQHKSAKAIKTFLEEHEHRIEWQVQRIYRTRNSIVHAGQYYNYINTVLLNLREYYLNTLLALECYHANNFVVAPENISEIFERVVADWRVLKARFMALGKHDKLIDDSNIEHFIPIPCLHAS